jgi:serine/threonine protein kinase
MLAPGSRIASYEVLALLGTGGMGEVYRARDLKLGREVAIKLLPDQFAHDPDRLARFQREAQVLASLNHPNIAAIYGLEETEETKALILELVPGKRCQIGPLAGRSPSRKPFLSRSRSRRRWRLLMNRASSIVI